MINLFKSQKQKTGNDMADIIANNPQYLIIVGDPETDTMAVGYKGKCYIERIVDQDKKKMSIVKKVLNHSRFSQNIDSFTNITSILLGYVQKANDIASRNADQFLLWVGSKIQDLAREIRYTKIGKMLPFERSEKTDSIQK